eukprot:TRINITY_DN9767_c0_g1_i1.p1 TRINITY_DN9767_c0_g1~~TRINITY_DN9767_c0_g1_i1.p1  ORF type:complete len:153 (-),score=44.43 TRINITY_DN9767_c0_g1_i1:97-555(-)
MGVAAYNAECRAIVMRYSGEWEAVVRRIGRWIDFRGGYKTLDATFMESVWWVFSELYKKGLVYRGFRVMPYSTGCTTPLSNFEANQNYKDVDDPAVTVSFPVLGGRRRRRRVPMGPGARPTRTLPPASARSSRGRPPRGRCRPTWPSAYTRN